MSPIGDDERPGWWRPIASLAALALAVALAVFTLGRWTPAEPTAVSPTSSPSPAQQYTQSALDLIEGYSLYIDMKTWPGVQRRALASVAHAVTRADTYGALDTAVKAATDGQGRLVRPDAVQTAVDRPISVQQPAEGIAVLVLPSADSLSVRAASRRATQIATRIREAAPSCGWAIDLRGGSANFDYGTLAGLSPFLREGQQYSTVNRGGGGYMVTVAVATAFVGGRQQASVSGLVPTVDQPVAVLQDRSTDQSGEALVMALRRNPRVQTFGARTSGAATTELFTLADGARLELPTTRIADSDGDLHPDGLAPDHPADGDAVLQTAIEWLQRACSH